MLLIIHTITVTIHSATSTRQASIPLTIYICNVQLQWKIHADKTAFHWQLSLSQSGQTCDQTATPTTVCLVVKSLVSCTRHYA